MHRHYLVTTFNHRVYLGQMLDSIRAKYLSLKDFREQASVLVVDDLSTTARKVFCAGFATSPPNIQAHCNTQNRGIGPNRNFLLDWLGCEPVAADYVVLFVDGDDMLTSTHLQDKLAAFAVVPQLQCVGGQPRATQDFAMAMSSSCVSRTVCSQFRRLADAFARWMLMCWPSL